MRVTVCTVDGHGAFNGINAWLQRFVPALAERGHIVAVLAFPWSEPKNCPTLSKLRKSGIQVSAVYPRRYTEQAVRSCVIHAKKFRPDMFIANLCVPALHAAPIVARLGARTISVLHNDDAEYRAKAGFPTDATVAISRGLLSFPPPDSPRLVRSIPYGVEPSDRVATAPVAGRPFRIVYHGRIAQVQKRILELASALVLACKRNASLEADIYGSGPDEESLRQRLANESAGGRVRFLGPVAPEHIRKLLPDYHAAVLVSDFEGLGLAILEAMAAGLVPVCRRTSSGLPDIISSGRNGLFVEDGGEEFISALQRLATDSMLWRSLSAEAIRTASTQFSPKTCLDSWEQLFTDLHARPSVFPTDSRRSGLTLAPVHPDLVSEDVRHPGMVRATWRWFRFGVGQARRPW